MALGLQEAVQRANEILEELYPNRELKHVLLEEIERSGPPGDGNWEVTLGFTRPGTVASAAGPGALGGLGLPTKSNRVYKRIRIDAETGGFEGMTDRDLEEIGRS